MSDRVTGNWEEDVSVMLQIHANDVATMIAAYPNQRREILRRAFARRMGALDADGCDAVSFASGLRRAAIAAFSELKGGA